MRQVHPPTIYKYDPYESGQGFAVSVTYYEVLLLKQDNTAQTVSHIQNMSQSS